MVLGEGTRIRLNVVVVKVLTILNYLRFLFDPAGILRVKEAKPFSFNRLFKVNKLLLRSGILGLMLRWFK